VGEIGPGSDAVMNIKETMVERRVTYTLEHDGRFIIVENVPARVCVETGEQFFSLETVERLQQMVWEGEKPKKVIETPVYEFAA
jgi:YgiT-type zinc finger domain-containing protein